MIKKYTKFFLNSYFKREYLKKKLQYFFALKVLKSEIKTKNFEIIEKERSKLLKNNKIIEVEDFGAGSKRNNSPNRRVAKIAKTSLSSKKKCILLKAIVDYTKAQKVLEFGTSLGISALHMADAVQKPVVYTVEADKNIAGIAKSLFEKFTLNIELFNETFDDFILKHQSDIFDVIYIDGNHKKEATLKYFQYAKKHLSEKGVVIFDDIRWSDGMYEAWEQIYADTERALFIDNLKTGIIFFNYSMKKRLYIPGRIYKFV